jgi:hypothetical protein
MGGGILVKTPEIEFQEVPPGDSGSNICGKTETTKLLSHFSQMFCEKRSKIYLK